MRCYAARVVVRAVAARSERGAHETRVRAHATDDYARCCARCAAIRRGDAAASCAASSRLPVILPRYRLYATMPRSLLRHALIVAA